MLTVHDLQKRMQEQGIEADREVLISLRPTDTMKALDDASIDDVAQQVEDKIIAIMKEAAG